MIFFDRKIEITVLDILTKKSKTYKNLYAVIDIQKSNSSTPNKSGLQIYNLNAESRKLFEKENNAVIISAGYGINVKQIYSGQIKKGLSSKKEVDVMTTVELYDGINIYKNTTVNKSFTENVTGRQILEYLVSEMNITVGSLLDIPETKYNNGFSACGFAKDVLKTVTKKMGLKWYIQDGELYIHGKNKSNGQNIFKLTYQSGLISAPEPTESKGYKLICFLNPEFRIGRPVEIDTPTLKGVYIINSINFKGDNEEGEFTATIEVS